MFKKRKEEFDSSFHFYFILKSNWRTVKTNIDFVDFILAKSFLIVVDEWFSTLKPTPKDPVNKWLVDKMDVMHSAVMQGGRVGMAGFLACYVYLQGYSKITLGSLIEASSFGLLTWALVSIVEGLVSRSLTKRVMCNIIPTVIILGSCDSDEYKKIVDERNSGFVTMAKTILSWAMAIALNIAASYIFVKWYNNG
jgi:hypothetical protein